MECLRLPVKDVAFTLNQIVVRSLDPRGKTGRHHLSDTTVSREITAAIRGAGIFRGDGAHPAAQLRNAFAVERA